MKEMDIWELQSKTIDRLRFPLIVMVVFIHNIGRGTIEPVNLADIGSLSSVDYLNLVRMAFSNVIPRVAVPAFFLISGYLFFIKVDIWNKSTYIEEIKKRIKTLLVPYVLWNTIYLVLPIAFFYALLWHKPENLVRANEYFESVNWVRWIWDFSFINDYNQKKLVGNQS